MKLTTSERSRPSRAGRPQDSGLDHAIAEASLQVLAERGYEGLSIELVARRAGTAKTSIYRRFSTKNALVVAALGGLEYVESPDTGSLRGDLLARINSLSAHASQRFAVLAGLLLARRGNPELAEVVQRHVMAPEDDAFERILTRASSRGELAGTPKGLESLASVMPSLLFTRLLIADRPIDDDYAIRLVDEILLPLLKAS